MDTIFIAKVSKGYNSVKNVGGVTVLILCTWPDSGLYFYKVSWKYSGQYQSYRADTIFIRKISKGHNSVKNVGGVSVLVLCTSSDGDLYFYKVSWKYSGEYQSYRVDTIFIAKVSKGYNSVKNVGGVTVLILCTWPDSGLYFYKVSWKYSGQYQSYRADTIFIRKISKGHNSVKNVGGVSVLVLCTSSDDGLYLCIVSWKYLERYHSYGYLR